MWRHPNSPRWSPRSLARIWPTIGQVCAGPIPCRAARRSTPARSSRIWFLRHQRYGTGALDEVEHIFPPLIVDGAGPALPARQFIGIAASKSGRR